MPSECVTVSLAGSPAHPLLIGDKLSFLPGKLHTAVNCGHPFNFSSLMCVRVGGRLRLRGVTPTLVILCAR